MDRIRVLTRQEEDFTYHLVQIFRSKFLYWYEYNTIVDIYCNRE